MKATDNRFNPLLSEQVITLLKEKPGAAISVPGNEEMSYLEILKGSAIGREDLEKITEQSIKSFKKRWKSFAGRTPTKIMKDISKPVKFVERIMDQCDLLGAEECYGKSRAIRNAIDKIAYKIDTGVIKTIPELTTAMSGVTASVSKLVLFTDKLSGMSQDGEEAASLKPIEVLKKKDPIFMMQAPLVVARPVPAKEFVLKRLAASIGLKGSKFSLFFHAEKMPYIICNTEKLDPRWSLEDQVTTVLMHLNKSSKVDYIPYFNAKRSVGKYRVVPILPSNVAADFEHLLEKSQIQIMLKA